MNDHRLHTTFRGRVQGVGFRATTCDAAARAGVRGWVRNAADGSVECVAEGTDAALRNFLESLLHAMGRFVESHDSRPEAATGEFDGFTVRP